MSADRPAVVPDQRLARLRAQIEAFPAAAPARGPGDAAGGGAAHRRRARPHAGPAAAAGGAGARRCTPRRRCTRRCATARGCWPRSSATARSSGGRSSPAPTCPWPTACRYRAFDVPTTKRDRFGAGADHGRVVGYRLTDERSGGTLVYLPGVQRADAGRARGDRGLRLPADRRHLLARRRADPARPGRQDVAARWATCRSTARTAAWRSCASLGRRRTIYVHINNTNPILLEDAPERRMVDEQRHGGGRGRPRGRGVRS